MYTKAAHRKPELFDPIRIRTSGGRYPECDEDIFVFILMGPTGAGKSAFIEAIARDKNLSISKNSLDSVTKEVTPYVLDNRNRLPVILIDTPGLLDIEIAESTIIHQVLQEIQGLEESCNRCTTYVHLLYFERITDNRMSGRKLRVLNLFKYFAEHADIAYATTVVTTMWNELYTSQQFVRAFERLEILQDQFWKHLSAGLLGSAPHSPIESSQKGVSRFMNTHESALDILKSAWCIAPDLSPHVPFQGKARFDAYLSMTLLSGDIIRERIGALQQTILNVEDMTHWIKFPFVHRWRIRLSHEERNRHAALIQSHRKDLSDLAKECIIILRQQLPIIELESSRMQPALPYHSSWCAATGATQAWTERFRIKELVKVLCRDLIFERPLPPQLNSPPPTPPPHLRQHSTIPPVANTPSPTTAKLRHLRTTISTISKVVRDIEAWWTRNS